MSKALSDSIFTFRGGDRPKAGWERCNARDVGLPESWFRDSIFESPSIVIEACRAAGVTDDDWYPWAREFHVEVGPIDVLLVSSQGKVAIVETKLSHNPELRRKVLAQALDYLAHLADAFEESMPPIPVDANGIAVADVDDIRASVANSDVLLIIASDEVDPRVAKLSQSLIADNLINGWELVLVDMALFRPLGAGTSDYLVVPTIRNVVLAETRQVVRVIVEGETPRAHVRVERDAPVSVESGRRSWNEAEFFAGLEERAAPAAVRQLAARVRELARANPETLELAWGSGRKGSMTLKRRGLGLIEIYTPGMVRFRPYKFERALGQEAADSYRSRLAQLAPSEMRTGYPRIGPAEAAAIADQLFALIQQAITAADRAETA